jgi:hypothetical protein
MAGAIPRQRAPERDIIQKILPARTEDLGASVHRRSGRCSVDVLALGLPGCAPDVERSGGWSRVGGASDFSGRQSDQVN